MRRQKLIFITLILVIVPAIVLAYYFHSRISTVEQSISHLISGNGLSQLAPLQAEEVEAVSRFYRKRNFTPFWIEKSEPNLEALFLLKNLGEARNEGLLSTDYFVEQITAHQQSKGLRELGELDALLTAAFNRYANHLHHGRISAALTSASTTPLSNDVGITLLEQSSADNNLFSLLYKQAPSYEQYDRLRKKLFEYQDIASKGGWPILPTFHTLKQGMKDNRIIKLRQRLKVTGDIQTNLPDSNLFDNDVKKAIASYQSRYDLPVTGLATPETIAALNVPVEKRIKQILINMERWHALPHDFGTHYILINAAGSELIAAKNSKASFDMRAVTANTDKPELVAMGKIRKITLNPQWQVPAAVVKEQFVTRFAQDPQYFSTNGYRLVNSASQKIADVPITEAMLTEIAAGQSEFRLMKLPDRNNPMGRIAFEISDQQNLILHDTPYRNLFSNNFQYADYGSVAIENPWRLANYLLASDSAWNSNKLRALLQDMKSTEISLNETVDVFVVYLTAWVDDNNQISFHQDSAGYDDKIAMFLKNAFNAH